MKRTFGTRLEKIPTGYVARVVFPSMATMDQWTGDGRRLSSMGANTRDLPRPISYMPTTQHGPGEAKLSGRIDYIEFTDDGNVYGEGFLLDDQNGRDHARLIALKALSGNSIELAETEVEVDIDWDTFNITFDFVRWSLAATTGVAVPAFANARAEVTEGEFELTADASGEVVLTDSAPWTVTFAQTSHDEMVASLPGVSAPTRVSFDDFVIPEADRPTKIVVTEDGLVYGHLGAWDSCHMGFADDCVLIPRSKSGYSSYHKAGVLTDKGQIETGPIFLAGGHRKGLRPEQVEAAYGGIENTWADVRIVDGQFGPWLSGRIRPGMSEDKIYAARASRISGHWIGGELYAIVSVNAEGFNVKGSGMSFTTDANGAVTELFAGFNGGCDGEGPELASASDVAKLLVDALDG